MDIKYFKTANNDIKSSPGSFKKILLLGLICLIPIFGIIAVTGYVYGWAREIAWGTRAPLPQHIFGNEDGKQYSRGFFALVISFVFGIIPAIVISVGSNLMGFDAASSISGGHYVSGPVLLIGGLIWLVGLVGALLANMLAEIGTMRMSIYGKLGTGLQFQKVWAMFKQDTRGALKIMGMELLIGLIFAIVFGIILSIVMAISIVSTGAVDLMYNPNPSDEQVIAFVLSLLGQMFLISIVFSYIAMAFASWLSLLVGRAWGYWTSQFNVPAWRGSNDPMPFESGYAAYTYGATQATQQQAYEAQYYQAEQAAYQQGYTPQTSTYQPQGYAAPTNAATTGYAASAAPQTYVPQQTSYPQQGGYPYAAPTNYPDPSAMQGAYPSPTAPTQASMQAHVPTQAPAEEKPAEEDIWSQAPLLGTAPVTPAQVLSDTASDDDINTGEIPVITIPEDQAAPEPPTSADKAIDSDFSNFGPEEFGPKKS